MKSPKKVTVLQPTFSTQTAALSQNGSSKSIYWNRQPLSDDLNNNWPIPKRQSGINQYSTNTTSTRFGTQFIQNISSSSRHTFSVNKNCVISNTSRNNCAVTLTSSISPRQPLSSSSSSVISSKTSRMVGGKQSE